MINSSIKKLITYGIEKGFLDKRDEIYAINRILEILGITEYAEPQEKFENISLEETLNELLDYAVQKNLVDNNIISRDLFDTKLISALLPMPHEVIDCFKKLYKVSPKKATSWFYKFSKDTNYIRSYRIEKDIHWTTSTRYGRLDLTINLSKPEKDPKAIAAAKNEPAGHYPECMLCKENEGYAGRLNHPARQNLRIIPITINKEDWFFQYSPYVYYNEHCIAFNSKHIPMVINRETFIKLFEFINIFPHYFIGSNADLPIVGGSILAHDHFQGGNYEFAMARADIEKHFTIKNYEDIQAGILNWPMSVIRIRNRDYSKLIELAEHILKKWKSYTDESVFIYSSTNGEQHNTITPIARKRGDIYELDLVLRNNIRTEEHPLGVFHPHEEFHHIKKENIGLIEVMGLAVLPARLKTELEMLARKILNGEDLRDNELTKKHADWAEKFLTEYDDISEENINEIIRYEVGHVFVKILECAGVFKRDNVGASAFEKFMKTL